MGIHNLDKIFQPKSIAVIGASEKKGSIGSVIMKNLVKGGYPGEIYPVNTKHHVICNLPVFPSILNINAPVDLVVIATPIFTVPQIIKESVAIGAGGIIIISAGGKETGEQGKQMETRIKKAAEGTGIRIIGPNCLGVISSLSKMNASFASHMPLEGKMALISQSGAICTTILDLSIREKMGFSYFISVGSMLDVDFGDIIDYLGNDYRVSSIVMYIENLNRFRSFMSAARAVSRIKPIIAYKAGRSKIGAKAAASHTGALTGEDQIYDTAFKRAGIIRVKTFEELFDCAELVAKQKLPKGFGLAIITNAGGPGIMAVDARVLLKPSNIPAPLHLVISPYPNEQETHIKIKDGTQLFIRPIRPEDAPLFTDLFNSLSKRSVYRRFFSPIKKLSHSMLARFTQIDYDRHIALIAMNKSSPNDEMLGVARIILEADEKKAEFSLLVRDLWQGKGIGARLIERCLKIAKEQGNIKKVSGIVLPENTQMLKLGQKLGFKITRDTDSNHYILTRKF